MAEVGRGHVGKIECGQDLDVGHVSVGLHLGVQLLLDDPREGVQRHAEGVGRLAVQPRVADREHVDLLGSHLDGDRDGSVVGDAAVHELAAADRDRRKDAWNRAAREQRGHGRS